MIQYYNAFLYVQYSQTVEVHPKNLKSMLFDSIDQGHARAINSIYVLLQMLQIAVKIENCPIFSSFKSFRKCNTMQLIQTFI